MSIGSGIVLELEPVSCAVCGTDSASARTVFEGYDIEFRTCDNAFSFVECPKCAHWYLPMRPKEEDIDKIYANYLTQNTGSAYHPSGLVAWVKRNVFDKRRMKTVLKNLHEGSNVLEIGAGSGRQLEFFGDISPCPIELYANDICFDDNTRTALRAKDIRLLEGAIEDVETDARFDAIIGIHVIEHVIDPKAVFQWMADHLAPGGVLYFETPDTAAPARHLFKDNWGMTHFPRHFHLFSRKTLAELAQGSGLEIVRHAPTTSAPAWNMSIRNTMKMDALTRHKSIFEMFNYSNVVTLSFFTGVDLFLMLLGFPTSTQQLVARKPLT
jgi:2-polyprenyl-3-methyl-5-hydroxy-6-metoxy-1,4-benzoquinol methylase